MSANINATEEINTTVDAKKRAFMAKFGQYAVAGAGMSVLMAPSLSATTGSGVATVTATTVEFNLDEGTWFTPGQNAGTWATDDDPASLTAFFQTTSDHREFFYTGVFGGGSTSGTIYHNDAAVGQWTSTFTSGDVIGSVNITWYNTVYFD